MTEYDLERFDPDRDYTKLHVTEVTFKRVFLRKEMVVTDEVMSVVRDPARFAQRLSVQGSVWERYLERARVEHPKTWWDAFKLRWMPRWWLKRWPARMEVVELVATEVMHGRALPPDQSFVGVTVWRGGLRE